MNMRIWVISGILALGASAAWAGQPQQPPPSGAGDQQSSQSSQSGADAAAVNCDDVTDRAGTRAGHGRNGRNRNTAEANVTAQLNCQQIQAGHGRNGSGQ